MAFDVADRTRGLDGGADSYLVEPIEPDELLATVHALPRMCNAEQEARRINRNLEELVAERTRELAEANPRLAGEIADRQADAALWRTQKLDLIGQLTGGIAHDFNNLLMIISGNFWRWSSRPLIAPPTVVGPTGATPAAAQ